MHEWLLGPGERGNTATRLHERHPDKPWAVGNQVTPLIHGATYFAELAAAVRDMDAGDLLLFTDWRGDPDERLNEAGTEVSTAFCEAARRGVLVRGLVWRSHLDKLQFSERENRHLGEEIEAAGGVCLLDTRVRPGGSHHQKFVVLRHPGRPDRDVAFVGGIDLSHSRRDDAAHGGDPQCQPMAKVYGERPPWHDAQVAIRGPAVGDVEAVFRERWEDPAPATRNPLHRLRDLLGRDDPKATPLPTQLPDPAPCGTHTVQLLRTYPNRRPGYPYAPDGERSIARGYQKVLRNAERLIYVEDQYIWSREVATWFARALADHPGLRLIAVIPRFPDQDGGTSLPPNLIGRIQALTTLYAAGGDRVACYGIENHQGTPVYVHAKVCVIDDVWAAVGSANVNRRSWTHDSELACAVLDETPAASPDDGARAYARELRLTLAREHLDREDGDDADLHDPARAFKAFRDAAAGLDAWHADGRVGARPPGRLRAYPLPQLTARQRLWAAPLYRTVYDPDGRPPSLRRHNTF